MFQHASALSRTSEGSFHALVPEGWAQGRGAFGGLVLGTLLRALQQAEGDPTRTPRALTGDICGPVLPGPAEVPVSVLRRGNNQSNLRADLVQQGEILATANCVLSAPRRLQHRPIPVIPPQRPDWQQVEVAPLSEPIAPQFTQHYEYRVLQGVPYSGAPEARSEGFIRERVRDAPLDYPALVGLIDAWWPSYWAVEDRPRPMATVSFAAEFLAEPASLDPAAPLFFRSHSVAMHEGFMLELRELWTGDRPVVLNQQTFVLIK